MRYIWMFCVTLFLTFWMTCQFQNKDSVSTVFVVPTSNHPLRNIEYDAETNSFFVSARNVLYRFNIDNQFPMVKKKTGPNRNCFQSEEKKIYCGDDQNSVLILTPTNLITCGTLFGGRCFTRNKNNFSITSAVTNIAAVSDIIVPVVGKILNITVRRHGSLSIKSRVLFAKSYSPLPLSNLDMNAIFSISPNLEGKSFPNFLEEGGVYDIFLKDSVLVNKVHLDFRAMLDTDQFVFLLMNQNSTSSKLVKLCKSIDGSNPKKVYEDLPLTCVSENSTFRHLVHGTVVSFKGNFSILALFINELGKSAVCIYDESEIYEAFLLSRRHRFGCPKHDLQLHDIIYESVGNPSKCVDMNFRKENEPIPGLYDAFNSGDFCNDIANQVSHYGIIIGLLPLVKNAIFATDLSGSVIESQVLFDSNMLFIGTQQGTLVTVYTDTGGISREIYQMKIDEFPVTAIKLINEDIYIMTDNKITKVENQSNCSHSLHDCISCMSSKSIYCGWCLEKQTCTLKENCTEDLHTWMPSVKNTCLKLDLGDPKNHYVDFDKYFKILAVRFIPVLQNMTDIKCRLKNYETYTIVEEKHIICYIDFNNNSSFISKRHPGNETLHILQYNNTIASTYLYLYGCSHFKRCEECLSMSAMGCFWCGTCTRSRINCNDEEKCPKIMPSIIKIPNEVIKNVTFQGINLIKSLYYQCEIGDSVFLGIVLGDKLMCKNIKIMYNESLSTQEFRVQFRYGTEYPLRTMLDIENERKGPMIIAYKCNLLSPNKMDCSTCVYFNQIEGYECQWCGNTFGCLNVLGCQFSSKCPAPVMTEVDPSDGPVGGGTIVTVKGINFGLERKDIDNITIAGILCTFIDFRRQSLQCIAGTIKRPVSGPVRLSVQGVSASSKLMFSYKDPILHKVSPKKVITSGGRRISIYGQHLLIGNKDVNVTLLPISYSSETKQCHVVLQESTDEVIVCVVAKSRTVGPHTISISFDSQTVRNLTKFMMTYIKNPEVKGTVPTDLRSIYSGGLNFELFGDGFVAEIEEMTVISPFTKYMKNLCHRKSSSLILCKFPPLSPRALRGNTIDSFSLTLQFDDFTYILPNKVDYKRDPTFNPLNNNKTFVFDPAAGDNTIVITGEDFTLVAAENDYQILIGQSECVITELHDTNITCIPPYSEPKLFSNDGNIYMKVHLGFLTTVIGSLQYPTKRTSHFQYEVIAFVSVPAIVVGLVLMACLYRRRNRRELETFDNQEINLGYEMLLTSPTNYRRGVSESIMVVLKDKHLLISSDDLHLGDVVGQGNFGIVYEGTLKCGNTMEKVAVKTLHKRNPRKIDIDEFINEALQMFNFQHENVMPLTGICLSLDEMPLIVLPFMQHGNLLTFIMKTDRVLTLIRLLQFGLDIAKGMLYISTKCIVHRDLAARNCLLDENEVAIVSDFVLSRDIYEKDYYTSSNQKCKLPVKWMAPESLEKGIYNTQSDVWSYGVVLWELLTRGSKPYPEVDGWDMLKYLKSNRRLHKPLYCPDVVYRLTEKCWALDPCNRPTFSDIVEELTSLIATRDQHFSKENTFENIEDINISTEVDFDC